MPLPVVLFHHALGHTPGVSALAERLRAEGLEVVVPDLYEGATFSALDDGVAHALAIGFGEVIARGASAVDASVQPVVVGLSLGVLPAQFAAQTINGVRAAVLVGACVPLGEFGDQWPAGVTCEVHAGRNDPIFDDDGDADAAAALAAISPDATIVRHDGAGHLLCEMGHADFDQAACDAVIATVIKLAHSV
jgi:dienelactone hydrolase